MDYYPVEEEQVQLVSDYTDLMVDKMSALIGTALADLAPAELHTGSGEATFAVNRRNNKESEVPRLLASGAPLKGPVDHTVPVMTVRRRGKTESGLVWLRLPPNDAQLHHLVWRLSWIRSN